MPMRGNCSRFTLMDCAVLIAALALGMSFATYLARIDTPIRGVPPRVAWAVTAVLWSGAIAGPLILLAQCVRGRRTVPSWGEWLWLTPSSLYLLVLASVSLGGPGLPLILAWVAVQCLASFTASCRLIASLAGLIPGVACRWTDLLGCSVCTAFGPAILYSVNEAMSHL
jgi:hypothetical protein